MELKTLAIFVAFLLTSPAFAQESDAALNDAYRAALHSPRVYPEFLKWTEIHWIAYREAEADLQARLGGETKPDSLEREASLKASTELRVQELHHLAKDGFSGDMSEGSADQTAVRGAYESLRQAAEAKGDSGLLSAVITDQKAWLQFAGLQADYDGYRRAQPQSVSISNRRMSMFRMDQLRLAQLQADLAKIGISTTPKTTSLSGIAPDEDRYTEISLDGLLRIEQTDLTAGGYDSPAGATGWVVSNKTGQRELLPQKDDEAGMDRGNPTVAISEYSISPDNQWIFRTQKFYHGMCGAYLYRRIAGLKYEKATSAPLDLLAWRFFQTKTGFSDASQGGVVRFIKWTPNALRISLNASERLTFGNVNDWEVNYDLKTGQLLVPADEVEHDRQAVDEEHR